MIPSQIDERLQCQIAFLKAGMSLMNEEVIKGLLRTAYLCGRMDAIFNETKKDDDPRNEYRDEEIMALRRKAER